MNEKNGKTAAENMRIIEASYDRLIEEIKSYRPNSSLDMIDRAYRLAVAAHNGQYRESSEPFVVHPIEVAIILAKIRADMESIAASILHDVVEDTSHTLEDLTEQFGDDVALLVDGVTKIRKVDYVSKTDEQAANYRKMFLHMSKDVRVLLIKIADRLHNMRTLDARSPDKQSKVGSETLEIYAPLAHKLGIAHLRYELEDLGFKYTDREQYNELARKVKLKQTERQELVEELITEIRQRLEADGIKAKVQGRAKRFYSTYKKMMQKTKTLDEIHDLYAVRVLVDTKAECYEVLGRLHDMYTPVFGRFKDYIGTKKPNGYQSLHTTLIGKSQPFEVQIRTFEMHDVAEYGIAAHWKYKEGGKAAKDKWLQDMMNWQRDVADSDEFLSVLKMDLNAFKTHIYCFSPTGDVYQLIEGATVIDFAYAIHSALGNRMVGARVNGKIVPLEYELHTGDRVEILESQNSKGPNRDWLQIVKTPQARNKITQWYNKENRGVNIQRGRATLEEAAKAANIPLDEMLKDGRTITVLERFNCRTLDQLYALIGVGGIKEKVVANFIQREYEKSLPPMTDAEVAQSILDAAPKKETKNKGNIVVKGVGDTDYRFGKCCSPLPGDEITGYVTRGRGLTIHRTDCINITHMDELDRKRLIDAHWQVRDKSGTTYHADLRFACERREGLLLNVIRVLNDEKVRASSVSAREVQSETIVNIGIEIFDGEHLNHLTTKLKTELGAYDITRLNA
ncbi:MAG: bifunctional (p)ppGpp synthetase/guanosine-3',5'-bis(diphosphate) 3'-pyrophosphohydrolase [Defluviitaleaceae bacterium]|nr:bifunctional (p)ppGpp synthetase/guanosine-3',5'-bis(diphosphate) 3'-pyrophosphohydrolase [Defluviitaleaceae bacterium]